MDFEDRLPPDEDLQVLVYFSHQEFGHDSLRRLGRSDESHKTSFRVSVSKRFKKRNDKSLNKSSDQSDKNRSSAAEFGGTGRSHSDVA